ARRVLSCSLFRLDLTHGTRFSTGGGRLVRAWTAMETARHPFPVSSTAPHYRRIKSECQDFLRPCRKATRKLFWESKFFRGAQLFAMPLMLTGRTVRARFLVVLALACLFYVERDSISAYLHFLLRVPADHAIQEDDIRESVFRYRMDHQHLDGPFFLSISGEDPGDTFMTRFANADRKVKKASQSYFKEDPSGGLLRDRSTDEHGVWFSVGAISWLSRDRVEVNGAMYCGGLCADGGIYRLRKKDGRWVVESYKKQWVS